MTLRALFLYSIVSFATASHAADGDPCRIPDLPEPSPLLTFANEEDLPPDAGSVVLDWPIASAPVLNSPFGPRRLGTTRYDWHRGVDMTLPMGTDLFAPADAVVVHAGTHPGYADTIVQLRHNQDPPYFYTLYLHLEGVDVVAGEFLQRGDQFARSGQGSASYPHLHWEVRIGCLRQECCESPYSYLNYPNNPPAPPVLDAHGWDPHLGKMILLSFSVPNTEIDFQQTALQWGSDDIVADVNELNRLSPTGAGSRLDDPLFFFEEEARPLAFLPKRYRVSYANAEYQLLFVGLDETAQSGSAHVGDGFGATAQAPVSPVPAPVALRALQSLAIREAGESFELLFEARNDGLITRTLDFSAVSAQSLDLDVQPTSVVLPGGQSATVTVSGQLDGDWPEDVGDVVLLRAAVSGPGFTDLVAASFIDTNNDYEPPVSLFVY